MKVKRSMIIAMAAIAIALPSRTYAATYETEVINSIKMGDISISLAEYELDDSGAEIPYQDCKLVLPGQRIDKIVRITNEANTAWLRAKLEYTSEDGIKDLSDDMVTIEDDSWVKRGDYYYYLSPVDRDASVDFIKKVTIPPQWDNSYVDKNFTIIVSADAVQTENFTPDFESSDPWFGTVIEACAHTVHDDTYVVSDNPFSVEFKGGAEGLVRVGDDFFSNWGCLMPGDVVSDEVKLKNSYGRSVKIYFRTETIADDMLLKALMLEIKNGDEVIYSGPLSGEITENISLAALRTGQEISLQYTLTVPAELNNQYALAATKTKWIFTAELRPKSSGGGGGSTTSGGPVSGGPGVTPETTAPETTAPEPTVSPDTGGSENGVKGPDNANLNDGDNPYGYMKGQKKSLSKTGDNRIAVYAYYFMVGSALFFLALLAIEVLMKAYKKEDRDHEK